LYCYEFDAGNFSLLDECAGYYISYQPEKPVSISVISDPIKEILSRSVELHFMPSILPLSGMVGASSLNFSMIRMRNART
jgi:hypothetical protein